MNIYIGTTLLNIGYQCITCDLRGFLTSFFLQENMRNFVKCSRFLSNHNFFQYFNKKVICYSCIPISFVSMAYNDYFTSTLNILSLSIKLRFYLFVDPIFYIIYSDSFT